MSPSSLLVLLLDDEEKERGRQSKERLYGSIQWLHAI